MKRRAGNSATAELSVYDGQRCIGRIVETQDECIASTADDRPLGAFATRKAALAAINAAYTPPATGGIIVSFTDPRLPRINDKIFVRTAMKNVDQVAAIFDGDQCVRIELKVLG